MIVVQNVAPTTSLQPHSPTDAHAPHAWVRCHDVDCVHARGGTVCWLDQRWLKNGDRLHTGVKVVSGNLTSSGKSRPVGPMQPA
jgi:hypothetical protein